MPIDCPELGVSGMVRPFPAAPRADVSDLFIPTDPEATIRQVNHPYGGTR
jgi:hypothetical protein